LPAGLLFAVPVWGQSACSFHLDIQLQEKHILEPVSPALVYIDELQKSFNADEQGNIHISGFVPAAIPVISKLLAM